jgi:NitT/TauT family transport system permease protein
MTAMFNPLPAIALLPLALNAPCRLPGPVPDAADGWPEYGLSGLPLVLKILVPAAFPSILAGLKIGWAFAWRTLIGAELVFGVASGKGGLGWYIFESKNQLDIPEVFAGLLTITTIGLLVENGVFRTLENRMVRRWGMQH